MKKALVTGGAGFIGSHLCERLIQLDYMVFCVDNLYSGSLQNIKHLMNNPNFVFINSDLCQISDFDVQEIYNLACPASPVRYQTNPLFTIHTSVQGSIKMAALAQTLKAKLFHASTSEIYGEPKVHPQPETYLGNVNPCGPRACYDEGKRIAESILFIYYHQLPFPLKIGRIFNTYGPKMHPEDGRVISNFVNQAIRGVPLTVYGDGSQTRSFCYVSDLVDAILLFMGSSEEVTGPINLGNPAEYTILEVAKLIIELTGSQSKIEYCPLPVDDPTKRRPDISLAKRVLHWEPKITLVEGLKHTIEYYRKLEGAGSLQTPAVTSAT